MVPNCNLVCILHCKKYSALKTKNYNFRQAISVLLKPMHMPRTGILLHYFSILRTLWILPKQKLGCLHLLNWKIGSKESGNGNKTSIALSCNEFKISFASPHPKIQFSEQYFYSVCYACISRETTLKNVEVNCSTTIHISNEIEEKTYFGFATRSKIFISFSRNSFVHCVIEVVHIKFALFNFFSFTRRPNLFKVRYDMISSINVI